MIKLQNVMGRGNIKQKVIFLVTSQLLFALLCVLVISLLLVEKQVDQQTEKLFINTAGELNRSLETRVEYLVENTNLLATNQLMVNALTDSEGREAYLEPLVTNFIKGKDVLYLNIVDFDGRPLFQTGENIPEYNRSSQLRTALALQQSSLFIDASNNLILISPIEYYTTSQGAIIVSFDLAKIIQRNIVQEAENYIRLLKEEAVIFAHNYSPNEAYVSYTLGAGSSLLLFEALNLDLEVGLPEGIYYAPTREAVFILLIIGFLLTVISLIMSRFTAIKITEPILELSSRVKQAHEGKDVLCSPLGSGDELEGLAKAFDERTLMLEYQAEHDSLTELPNRLLFLDRLEQAVKLSKRHNTSFAVLFIDLDRFKEVNDSYGHSVGDKLIQVVADLIEGAVRDSDSVARMGGDEFTVLINMIEGEEQLLSIIQKILALFKSPICFEQYQLFLTCSIGAAIYPSDGDNAETLLKNADAAMYQAKTDGRNTYHFYQAEMTETIVERVHLIQQMRQAIEDNQFVVYYQPQYNLITNTISGMEALIRWQHPEEGLVPPLRFIPLAEETGLIIEIDRFMMQIAMQEFSGWKSAGLSPGRLSMNLSMLQLLKKDFIDFVKTSALNAGIETTDLIFEVTETQAMLKPDQTISALNQLKQLGVGIAIDDFGTGFSSLSYLKKFPVDKIKIDRSFISDIPDDKDDMALTLAIIALSHNLNLSVIAEGLETGSQLSFLVNNGCPEGQGYFFSKPIPAEEITRLLATSSAPNNQPPMLHEHQ